MYKQLEKIYGNRNLKLLYKLSKTDNEYLEKQSNIMLADMIKIERIKDRNLKFKAQTSMKSMIKVFFDDFNNNLLPSPNLLAFFTAVELEIAASKYTKIEATFKKLAKDYSDSAASDFDIIMADLKETVKFELKYIPTFSDDLIKSWNTALNYLGSSLLRIMKYNEFAYNQEQLIDELVKLNTLYYEKNKNNITWINTDFSDEKNLWFELYYRIKIVQDLFTKDTEIKSKHYPDDIQKDIKYIKTTCTKLLKTLDETKVEIENRVSEIKEVKKENKYQKYAGINLKHWKKIG